MAKFKFYHIQEKYINYLHSIDNRVQMNKGEHRPYVGVVLSVNGMSYYVPLESPKPNHANLKSGGPVLKLDNGRLGIMGFNNMIPVVPACLLPFDFKDIQDEKYKMLLINQLNYCEKNAELIVHRAEVTYRKAVSGCAPFYTKICCNFKKLERKASLYDPNYVPKIKKKINPKGQA